MKYHCFIFNWVGQEKKTIQTYESILSQGIKTTVINSDESLVEKYNWIHIGEQAYFSEQFNKAMEMFDDDVMFHIQGDAQYDNWGGLVEDSLAHFKKYHWGVYAPNIDWTPHVSNWVDRSHVEEDLREVSNTDCTCWLLHRDIVKKMPAIDLKLNKFGWGIDIAMIYLSNKYKRKVLRNYKHLVSHPRSTGYDSNLASLQCNIFIDNFIKEIEK